MTKQEYFNLLVETSRNGGFPSSNGDSCRYRNHKGKKCAVGLLIDDEDYDINMEFKTVTMLLHSYPNMYNYIPKGITLADLKEIQNTHDILAQEDKWDHEYFVKRLKEVFADCQELTFNVTLGES